MAEPELEISRAGIKVGRIGPLAVIVVITIVCETAVTSAAMWINTERAQHLWTGFSVIAAALIAYPLLGILHQATVEGWRRVLEGWRLLLEARRATTEAKKGPPRAG